MGCLHPFQGQLYEDNFKEIMECLRALANEFGYPQVGKYMVADVLSIIRCTEWWIEPGGMLTRNHLLTSEQESMLREWVDIIFDAVVNPLDGSVEEAFMSILNTLKSRSRLQEIYNLSD